MIELIFFATGIVIGAMNAIAGGGLLIGFPVMLALGFSPLQANATGFLAMVPGQFASAVGYRKYLRKVPKYYLLLLIPCITGAAVGSYLLRHTPESHFSQLVPGLILLAVALFAVQPYLHYRIHSHITGRSRSHRSLLLIGLALLVMSVYGGYFGPGFGFILLAFLGFTKLNQVHQMNGLKNIAAVCMGLTSVIVLANGPYINWQAGLLMGIGSIFGGYFGSRIALKTPSQTVRTIVIIIGVVTATLLAVHDYS